MFSASGAAGSGAEEPFQILVSKSDKQFVIKNEQRLRELLLDDDVRERQVVVLSVAGAFRKGKSFLLNFFLRYLNFYYNDDDTSKTREGSWLGDDSTKLKGFSWKGGSDRDTTGIMMWSKIFKTQLENGDKVAIILLDTQGLFDSKTTKKECVNLFAMSTMISSIQIYNLTQNIQEDDLENLQIFAEYGRLALDDNDPKPFQNLLFLVRDWSNAGHGYPYGSGGGARILAEKMSTANINDSDMKSVRKHIKDCFTDISCFLLPHPGFEVSENPAFKGQIKDIRAEFVTQLKDLIPMLLAPQNLTVKRIHSQPIPTLQLFDLFKTYTRIFKDSKKLPLPTSIFKATTEANNFAAIKLAKHCYVTHMKIFLDQEMFSMKRFMEMFGQLLTGTAYRPLDGDAILKSHNEYKAKALELFDAQPKMGGAIGATAYRSHLVDEIEDILEKVNKCNEGTSYYDRLIQIIQLLSNLLRSVLFRDPPSFLPIDL